MPVAEASSKHIVHLNSPFRILVCNFVIATRLVTFQLVIQTSPISVGNIKSVGVVRKYFYS